MSNKIFIPLLAVFIAILATTTLLSAKVWNPSWNPFQNTTQSQDSQIIQKSVAELSKAQTFKYSIDLQMDVKQAEKTANFILGIEGALDKPGQQETATENIKTANKINFSMASGETNLNLSLDANLINKNLYLRIITLPDLSFIPMLNTDWVKNLQGQWIVAEESQVKQLSGLETATESPDKASQEEMIKGILRDLNDLSQKENIFKISKKLETEKIDGDSSTHYLVSIDKEAVKKIIPEYFQLLKKYSITSSKGVEYEQQLEQSLEKMPRAIDDAWEKLNGIEFDAWITNDGKLKMIKFEKTLNSSQLGDTSTFEAGPTKATIKATIKFSDFNEPVNIQEPSGAKTIEGILGSNPSLQAPDAE